MNIDFTSEYAADQFRAQQALILVMDPELGINIVDMGLVYKLDFSDPGSLQVQMTLSSPSCPMGESILLGVEKSLQQAFPKRKIEIELVWEPVWSADLMSEEGKQQLNWK
ncbi:metal-sulfur cluster assembly factor [Pseudopedobacter sp.]|uniref:metal-sulfur cluster assembly factor n=1 Tax=Pseudopedobacter sp. TaxID=1936787 RepID=UPI003342D92C